MEGEYVNQELIHKPAQTVCADLTVDTKGSSSQVIPGEHKCRIIPGTTHCDHAMHHCQLCNSSRIAMKLILAFLCLLTIQ